MLGGSFCMFYLGDFCCIRVWACLGVGFFPVRDVFLFFLMIAYNNVFITLDFDKDTKHVR